MFSATSRSFSPCILEVFSIAIIFRGLLHSFSSLVGLCLANVVYKRLSGCSVSNLAPCSDSSTYEFMTSRICCIFGAYTRRCFIIFELYPMKIPFQFLWISN